MGSVTRNEDGTVEFLYYGEIYWLNADGLWHVDHRRRPILAQVGGDELRYEDFRALLAEAILALDNPPIKCHCSVPSYKCPDLHRCSTGPRAKEYNQIYSIGDSK